MLLMLEKWPSGNLELAMLLDESPMHDVRAMKAGEPWRADSALSAAARSVDLEGHAWLYVVFLKDDPATWGSKMVKLLGGGRIFRKKLTKGGVWTGQYTPVRYEVVARHVFHNVVGADSKDRYKLITECRMETDIHKMYKKEQSAEEEEGSEDDREEVAEPGEIQEDRRPRYLNELRERTRRKAPKKKPGRISEKPAPPPPPDPLFGPAIPQVEDRRAPFLSANHIGCCFRWESEKGTSEQCFAFPKPKVLEDEKYTNLPFFLKARFYLIEYQRRPFVRIIMGRLGFVRNLEDEEGEKPPRLEDVCSGHVQNIGMSVDSIARAAKSRAFRDSPVKNRR